MVIPLASPLDAACRDDTVVARHQRQVRVALCAMLALHRLENPRARRADRTLEAAKETREGAVGQRRGALLIHKLGRELRRAERCWRSREPKAS